MAVAVNAGGADDDGDDDDPPPLSPARQVAIAVVRGVHRAATRHGGELGTTLPPRVTSEAQSLESRVQNTPRAKRRFQDKSKRSEAAQKSRARNVGQRHSPIRI